MIRFALILFCFVQLSLLATNENEKFPFFVFGENPTQVLKTKPDWQLCAVSTGQAFFYKEYKILSCYPIGSSLNPIIESVKTEFKQDEVILLFFDKKNQRKFPTIMDGTSRLLIESVIYVAKEDSSYFELKNSVKRYYFYQFYPQNIKFSE